LFRGCLGGIIGCQGVFSVYFVSETAPVVSAFHGIEGAIRDCFGGV